MNVDFETTLNSGQVFLWERAEKHWMGVDGRRVIRTDRLGEAGSAFFRLDDGYEKIMHNISVDRTMEGLVSRYGGLRILRQDPFQCLVSFIVSSNSSIHNIRRGLQRICRRFGEETTVRGKKFWLFPRPEDIACARLSELQKCGIGYRARYVRDAARAVWSGFDIKGQKRRGYDQARQALLELPGVGNKVAECVMLFSLEKMRAFPVDTWIEQALELYYPNRFDAKARSGRRYDGLRKDLYGYFGGYAGYAQQFLFRGVRDAANKGW